MFDDLCAQHWQFEDLAPLDDGLRQPFSLAFRAGCCALVGNHLIDVRALTQGVAVVAFLSARWMQTSNARGLWIGFGQSVC